MFFGVLLAWSFAGVKADIKITPASLPNGIVGTAYSAILTASGCSGECTWSSKGTLPPGLSLGSTSGTISGTPTSAGSFPFTITATDQKSNSASQAYTIDVANQALTINTSSPLPDGKVGTAYSQTLGVSGGSAPYTWSVAAGSLPDGISLNSSSGTISGTPATANAFSFTVQVVDKNRTSATKAFALTIAASTPALSITTASALPAGTVGTAYAQPITASGGTTPYSWSVTSGSLPPGLSLSASSGALTGTPSAAGTFNFTIQVKDANSATATQAFTVTIASGGSKLTITTTSLPGGTVGAGYSQTLTAAGGTPPYSWAVTDGSLPPGLSLSASGGALTGTPSSAGTFNVTIQVKDANSATATQAFTVTIASGGSKLTITTTSLPGGSVGSAYSQTLTAAGGTPPYSWALTSGALPDGLGLDAGSGAITGTPSKAGTFSFTVRVTDKSSAVADQSLQLGIGSSAPPPTTPTLSFSGLPDTTGSAVQKSLDLVLSSAATQQVTGQIVLTFQPDAAAARDDPAVQFSTGSRTAPFTIPAGATTAVFSSGALAFQTGTVAGTLTFTASSNLPGGNPSHSVVVPRAGPILAGASVVQNGSGFQVQVAGFSNTRELAGASFHFTAASGQTVQTSDLNVSLASVASQWYAGGTSTQFGGQFLLVVPFSVTQGAVSGLSSVSVQLQNGQGASASTSANF